MKGLLMWGSKFFWAFFLEVPSDLRDLDCGVGFSSWRRVLRRRGGGGVGVRESGLYPTELIDGESLPGLGDRDLSPSLTSSGNILEIDSTSAAASARHKPERNVWIRFAGTAVQSGHMIRVTCFACEVARVQIEQSSSFTYISTTPT